jgi:serine phosphatase RsbU (regulator of sigma subunit)
VLRRSKADRADERPARPTSREDLFFSGFKKRPASALNGPAWRGLALTAGSCALAWAAHRLLPGSWTLLRLAAVTLFALTGWALAVRLLFLETKARVFWIVWLALSLVPFALTLGSRFAWVPAAAFSFVFLMFRRYRPYRHLTSKRQAALFGIGVVLFVLLTFFWTSGGPPPAPAPAGSGGARVAAAGPVMTLESVAAYSVVSLRWFWFFSLVNLFFAVRLHFMKLRPKLAVAAVLLIIVPIVLLTILGVGATYSMLGESHAARTRAILDDWARVAASDRDYVNLLSPRAFLVEERAGRRQSAGTPPPWLPELEAAVRKAGSPLPQGSPPRAVYILRDTSVWLLGISWSEGSPALWGCPVDAAFLDRLAGIVRSDVVLGSTNPATLSVFRSAGEGKELPEGALSVPKPVPFEVRGLYPEAGATAAPECAAPAKRPSFWRQPLFFGVTQLDTLDLAKGGLSKGRLILQTPRRLSTTRDELFSASNPLGTLVMASLAVLGLVFLVLETLALVFGLRVSGGITKAIKTLHQHLGRVSEGDLDSRVDIPNEDELGDLAATFNQMTAAVKQGREEAIAREGIEKELETARLIQERLLPHSMPALAGFEISGTSRPSHEVGGDYFDFLDLAQGNLGVAIADVAGKGIPAALLMANLQASLRAQAQEPGNVAAVAARLNALLVKNTDERTFVTFFYGILDRAKATFTYTNAGHNPPLLLRSNGKLERLEEGGLLLGFLSDQPYSQAAVPLDPGDVLVLFTDGITEAIDPRAESQESKYFGEDRLIETVRTNAGCSVRDIQAAILEAVAGHTRRSAQSDDITLVVIKRTGGREALAYVS